MTRLDLLVILAFFAGVALMIAGLCWREIADWWRDRKTGSAP